MTAFAKWLKATRIRRGITQAQLAQAVGVTHSYISHLEHGHFLAKNATPARRSAALIDAIAQVLGVPCEEARRAAMYGPPEPVPSSVFNPALMNMILKLPLDVQEDLKAQVETLYGKHCGCNAADFSGSLNKDTPLDTSQKSKGQYS